MKQLPTLKIAQGAKVCHRGVYYLIAQDSTDMVNVLLFNPENSQVVSAKIEELAPFLDDETKASHELSMLPEAVWADALKIYQIIKPLLGLRRKTKAMVAERAVQCNAGVSTLYKWIQDFEKTGRVSVFIRKPRKDKGKKELDPDVEKIIQETIATHYLTTQKISISATYRKVDRLCQAAGLPSPHPNTVKNRIKELDRFEATKAREGRKQAEAETFMIKRHFDDAIVPLQIVEVDHTPVDISLVDDIHRLPIGRPWLTLLIDVFSRMVLGFYISFDPPGNLSLGLCLCHAFLPKEKWLRKHGVEAEWPCWGLPRTIIADNAKEFRGELAKKACDEYGVNLEWRPVATPRYGAHIERYLGTLNTAIHTLPGTTFSNIQQRGDYDSDKHAVMTLEEFERWVTHTIVSIYHQTKHSSLGMAPIAKWKEGIIGTKRSPGLGIPPRVTDELKLKLDLLPFEERTVQEYGIIWDHIEYRHDVLRRWVNAPDPVRPKLKRQFVCRRDPRDISSIWFWDPEVNEYFQIPYRNTSHPAISIWEWRAAKAKAEADHPGQPVDEGLIFRTYEHLERLEQEAVEKTKVARRNQQRKRLGLQNSKSHIPKKDTAADIPASPANAATRKLIVPFDVDET